MADCECSEVTVESGCLSAQVFHHHLFLPATKPSSTDLLPTHLSKQQITSLLAIFLACCQETWKCGASISITRRAGEFTLSLQMKVEVPLLEVSQMVLLWRGRGSGTPISYWLLYFP